MSKENKTHYAILGMLAIEESSGYDIKKKILNSTNNFWCEADSSIYPAFKQLLLEKCVNYKVVNENTAKPKKVYSITEFGKSKLNNWLNKKPEKTKERNELLLKIYFGWNVPIEISITYLINFKYECEENLKKYEAYSKNLSLVKHKRRAFHQKLTIRQGILTTKALIEWCNESINDITSTKGLW